ncbi:AIPR family protein [Corynebacterium sp. UMB8791]
MSFDNFNTSGRTAVLRIENVNDANIGPLRRLQGTVKTQALIDLIAQEELLANPRRPKQTSITKEILETLQTSPEMMPYFSKGLLIGCSEVEERDRSRYQLHFNDEEREGVLDGGHNLMAIALAVLSAIGISETTLRKLKYWDQLKECWQKHLRDIEAFKRDGDDPLLETRIPVEIVSPRTDSQEDTGVNEFNNLILSICANRNQNAQLAADAIANQSGVFDYLKASLPQAFAEEVTWSTNDNKRVDPRLLVSLTWVALSEVPTLEDYNVQPLPATSAYSSKAEALSRFTKLLEAPGAAEKTDDGKSYVVLDTYIDSAFAMTTQVLECHDIIYKGYKDAYNATGGAFGRIGAVKKASKGKTATLYSNEVIEHEVPPTGFLNPVVFSLRALIRADKESKALTWLVDPVEFFANKSNLESIIAAVRPIIEMANWNPTTVGKNTAAYNAAYDKARNLVLERMLG